MKRRVALKKSLIYLISFMLIPHKIFANNLKEKSMLVQLIITFKIKKEKLASFLEIIKEVKVNLPKVDGCLGVCAFQDDGEKYTITLLESWESVEKHKEHIKHVIDSGEWKIIASHLIEDPISAYYHEI